MKKPITQFIVLVFIFIFVSYAFAEERITLTTYYPAPYGIYKELRADQMAVGSGYRNSDLENGTLLVEDRVGIGTAIPANKLQVHATTPNDHILITGVAPGIQFSNAVEGAELAAIGLATTNNHYVFGSAANDLIIRTVTNEGDIILVTGPDPTDPVSARMRIKENGNILIGSGGSLGGHLQVQLIYV